MMTLEEYNMLNLGSHTGSITITRFSNPEVIGLSFCGANTTGYFNAAKGEYYVQKLIEKKTSLFQKFINKLKYIKL